jgi:hypothetical protein
MNQQATTEEGKVCRHIERQIALYREAGVDLLLPPWEVVCLECVKEILALKSLDPNEETKH